MLLRLLEDNKPLDAVMFFDTGMEFDAIYRNRDKMFPMLKIFGVEYVELHPEKPFLYSMYDRPIKKRNGSIQYGYSWCGGVCRWGKRYKAALKDQVIDYVGIAADEPERFEKMQYDGKILPLVEWGMTEADCLKYCRDRHWNWNEETVSGRIDLYDVLDRVSCWCCRNKNLKELHAIHDKLPEYWDRLRAMQSRLDEPMKGPGKSIFDLERRFKLENEWIKAGKKIRTKEFYQALKEG